MLMFRIKVLSVLKKLCHSVKKHFETKELILDYKIRNLMKTVLENYKNEIKEDENEIVQENIKPT